MSKNTDIKIESDKLDLNKNDDETYKSHKYMANKSVEFWKTIKKFYRKHIL